MSQQHEDPTRFLAGGDAEIVTIDLTRPAVTEAAAVGHVTPRIWGLTRRSDSPAVAADD